MTLFQCVVLSIIIFVIGLIGVGITYDHAGSKAGGFLLIMLLGGTGIAISAVWFIVNLVKWVIK